jgi:phage shock protein PspC (stress-responsive transcriptional regulator)
MGSERKGESMPGSSQKTTGKNKKWFKSRKDRVLDGVCAGLAEVLGADVTLVRVIWLLTIFFRGLGLIAYVIAAVFVPVNPDHQSLKPEEKKKTNHALMWSVILILLGILFLWDRWDWRLFDDFPFHFPFFHWGAVPWHTVLPLALIALGIGYIIIAIRRDRPAASQDTAPAKTSSESSARPRMMRSRTDKLLAGVCAALAAHLEIDPTFVRIAFILISLLTHPVFGVIGYIALVLIIPIEKEPSES